MSESDGLPCARMAKVMCPAKATESTTADIRNVHLETRDMLAGVRMCVICRDNRTRRVRYAIEAVPASGITFE
jgi:hypothetical protein